MDGLPALWGGSLHDDQSFRHAFETIRPLYFHGTSLAQAANLARADTRNANGGRDRGRGAHRGRGLPTAQRASRWLEVIARPPSGILCGQSAGLDF